MPPSRSCSRRATPLPPPAGWRRGPASSPNSCTTTSAPWTISSSPWSGAVRSRTSNARPRRWPRPSPLRALWELSNDPAASALTIEFAALANHRKAIRAELASYGERFRQLQTEALTEIFERYGIDARSYPPEVMVVTMTSLSQVMGMETAPGYDGGPCRDA